MDEPVPGLKSIPIYNRDSGLVVPGVSMVRLGRTKLDDGEMAFEPTPRQMAKVIRSTVEGRAPFVENNIIKSASIIVTELPHDADQKRGRRRFTFGARVNDSVIIRIESGEWGGPAEVAKLHALMQRAPDGSFLPTPHGSVDRARSTHIIGVSEGDEGPLTKSRHLTWEGSFRYFTLVPSPHGEIKVFTRRADIWEMFPGSELLTGACVPGRLFRLIYKGKGQFEQERADEIRWRPRYEEALWNLQQRSVSEKPAAAQAAA